MSEFHADNNQRHIERLNRMEDVIQSMITLVYEQSRARTQANREMLEVIAASRPEIQDLILLQKEQRVDIMARFAANKDLPESFQKYFESH